MTKSATSPALTSAYGADARGSDDIEGVPPGDIKTLFATPAYLVQAGRGDRADQSVSGGKWEAQQQQLALESCSPQNAIR